MPLAYDPGTDQLVYSPATGQLALNCDAWVPGRDCARCNDPPGTPSTVTVVVEDLTLPGLPACRDYAGLGSEKYTSYPPFNYNGTHVLLQDTNACEFKKTYIKDGDTGWVTKYPDSDDCTGSPGNTDPIISLSLYFKFLTATTCSLWITFDGFWSLFYGTTTRTSGDCATGVIINNDYDIGDLWDDPAPFGFIIIGYDGFASISFS